MSTYLEVPRSIIYLDLSTLLFIRPIDFNLGFQTDFSINYMNIIHLELNSLLYFV